MFSDEFEQFVLSVVMLTMAGLVLTALFLPPDPLTQLFAAGGLLPVVLVASYVLAYRIGFEWT